VFIAALFIVSRILNEPRCLSTEEWIQKIWYIYTMEYYTAIKNTGFMKFLSKDTKVLGRNMNGQEHPSKNKSVKS